MQKKLYSRGLVALAAVLIVISTASAKRVVLEFDPANFTTPIDNTYMPMAEGQTYVYQAEEDDEIIKNEITNTGVDASSPKVILGVPCSEIHDIEKVYVADKGQWFITEETWDWQAWDNDGNVWYFGEDTVEYLYNEEWEPAGTSTEGSWEAGVDGAEPGILMLANPRPGLSYRQEYYEDEAEDMGKVLTLNASVSVEYGDFDNCLKTKEWTPLEPGQIEHKYYAPEVGLVFIEELKEKTVHVELIAIN